jgi:hypothetical protein
VTRRRSRVLDQLAEQVRIVLGLGVPGVGVDGGATDAAPFTPTWSTTSRNAVPARK